ncbi:Uu.00g029230.m01.CDS01 [Anthostomella pinea]|uniref:Uu.00g029230.m01.CDS01 n=1 Tax=Anthostomella pinea TaxID=933095 RepID=A0AAI8YCU2_9PEZI|nr:Uu.00g029230.m01.CDS01 [Anthostomella pinea]
MASDQIPSELKIKLQNSGDEKEKVVVKASKKPALSAANAALLAESGEVADADDLGREMTSLQRSKGYKSHLMKLHSVVRPEGQPQGPPSMLVLEHIPHGTLKELAQAIGIGNLPGSFIRSVFLCLVRIVTELAYPDTDGHDIPADPDVRPTELAHMDIRWNNLMFGDVEPGSAEHDPWPILKLIDFGQARDYTEVDEKDDAEYVSADRRKTREDADAAAKKGPEKRSSGIERNIRDLALVGHPERPLFTLPAGKQLTKSSPPANAPNLEQDVRNLIIQCLAPNPKHRPSLEELTALDWFANVTEQDCEDAKALVDKHIYNKKS